MDGGGLVVSQIDGHRKLPLKRVDNCPEGLPGVDSHRLLKGIVCVSSLWQHSVPLKNFLLLACLRPYDKCSSSQAWRRLMLLLYCHKPGVNDTDFAWSLNYYAGGTSPTMA